MSENLRHWNALGRTDPRHTKPFQRSGGFKGTATKPIWTEYRLTEHFGPCGVGWGCEAPTFNLVPAGDEILVFCTLRCWYMDGTGRAEVYGVGGDKVLVKQQSGLRTDDEAYKKAFTDALGNAFKHVGSGADVHMGLFEDSKYLAEVRREFAEEGAAPPAGERNTTPPSQPQTNGNAAPASRSVTLPPSPEEPPEIGIARTQFKLIAAEFREAVSEEQITDEKRGIWARNKALVENIRKHAGTDAIAKLHEISQGRIDQLRDMFPAKEAAE